MRAREVVLRGTRRCGGLLAVVLLVALVIPATASADVPPPTPDVGCGQGSNPETGIQGRVPTADYDDGRVQQGYTCNAEQVGHDGNSGGFRVYRYVDPAGHECAYYDTTLLVGVSVLLDGTAGVAVLDMSDPAHPTRTAMLVTPAMLSPHESLNLNQKRGLLAAIMGSPATAPGIIDVYDLTADCRHPVLMASTPIGFAGHEATFAPDGMTLYTAATALPYVSAIDLTNPSLPLPVWIETNYLLHGMNVSDDGTRLYAATLGGTGVQRGLTIFDVSQVQHRVANPQVPIVSELTWASISVPQTAIPVSIGGHPYLVEIDEYAGTASNDPTAPVGAGRIIDIGDEAHPVVVSDLRLAVNQPDARATDQAADPGATDPAQGYAGHYCAVPQRADPGIVACSFIVSGLRVFDIHDPLHPSEIAYFNPPSRDIAPSAPGATTTLASYAPGLLTCRLAIATATAAAGSGGDPLNGLTSLGNYSPAHGSTLSHWAMSAPTFVPERNEVWYSDGLYGFYAVRLTNDVWTPAVASTDAVPAAPSVADQTSAPRALPATGGSQPLGLVAALLVAAVVGASWARRPGERARR